MMCSKVVGAQDNNIVRFRKEIVQILSPYFASNVYLKFKVSSKGFPEDPYGVYTVKRSKDKFYMANPMQENVAEGIYSIQVNHKQRIILFEIDSSANDEKDVFSLLSDIDSIELHNVKIDSTGRYTIYSFESGKSKCALRIDKTSGKVFDYTIIAPNDNGTKLEEVTFTYLEQKFDVSYNSNDFTIYNYISILNDRVKLTEKYKSYRLISHN